MIAMESNMPKWTRAGAMAAGRTAAVAAIMALSVPAGAQQLRDTDAAEPIESISFSFLSPGAGATESSAAALVRLGDGALAVGGAVGGGDDLIGWNAAMWILTGAGPGRGLTLLGDLGYGSRVANGAAAALDGGSQAACAFAGTIYDRETPHPACWIADSSGRSEMRILPTEFGGEALHVAAGDVNGDGADDLALCGYTYDAAGNLAGVLWLIINGRDGNDQIETVALTNPYGLGDCVATSVSLELESVLISSWATRAPGETVGGIFSGPIGSLTFAPLGNLPAGVSSKCQDIEVENDETHWIGATVQSPGGPTRPALFSLEPDGSSATRTLPVLDGASNTQVNGIIAILIGLLVGGETETVGGGSATIWTVSGGQSRVTDLNRVPSNRPRGMRFNRVNMLLPYIEQDNLYKAVGDATNAAGQTRGFIATR